MIEGEESEVSSVKRAAKRRRTKEALSEGTRAVALETDAHTGLEQVARKMKITKSKYASAAVRHFIKAGINPLDEHAFGLLNVDAKIEASSYEIRRQSADMGNRLVAMWRTFERDMYKFMQTEQAGTVGYLERIEASIVNHQLSVERLLLAPLLEWIIRAGTDAHMTRIAVEQVVLNMDLSRNNSQLQKETRQKHDELREQAVISELRKILTEQPVPTPVPATRPVLAKAPVVPPPKPPTSAPATTVPTNPAATPSLKK